MAQPHTDRVPAGVERLRARGLSVSLVDEVVIVRPTDLITADMHHWLLTHKEGVKDYLRHEHDAPPVATYAAPVFVPLPDYVRPPLGKREGKRARAARQLPMLATVIAEPDAAPVEAPRPRNQFLRIPIDAGQRLTDGTVSVYAQALLLYVLRRTVNGLHAEAISVGEFRDALHCAPNTVIGAIKELEVIGVLQVERKHSGTRRTGVNRYTISWDGLRNAQSPPE